MDKEDERIKKQSKTAMEYKDLRLTSSLELSWITIKTP